MTELERNETAITYTTIQGTYYEIYRLDARIRGNEILERTLWLTMKHYVYAAVQLALTAGKVDKLG